MIYTLGVRTSGVAINTAAAELRTASTIRVRVREISIAMAAATASVWGLGRPAAIGITPTSPVTVLPQDPNDPTGTSTSALAWATAPTVPTGSNYLRRIGLPATIGAGWIWTFGPNELIIPVSSSLVVFNLAANGVADVTWVVEE